MKRPGPGTPCRGVPGAGAALLAACALAGPAGAASSASWVSLEGASASVGSLSASVQASSASFADTPGLAQGPHRVAGLEADPASAGFLHMHLQPEEGTVAHARPPAGGLVLRLPARVVRTAAVGVGDRVEVREQAHGLEFAHGQPLRVFFLALHEAGLQPLRTRVLGP